ncbi:MAG: hypothetical protein NT136_03910 [Candidatus Moranbacteria bacterium]|nr:hypothetical protein [Candidatus Moranbacteria bacterium]
MNPLTIPLPGSQKFEKQGGVVKKIRTLFQVFSTLRLCDEEITTEYLRGKLLIRLDKIEKDYAQGVDSYSVACDEMYAVLPIHIKIRAKINRAKSSSELLVLKVLIDIL